MPRVILGIGLVVCAEISDALHNDCGIIAASKGAFGVGPILLGLAPVPRRSFASGFALEPTGSLRGIFLKLKVACVMNGVRFVMSLYDELHIVFAVRESGQPEDSGRVGRCRIAAELRGHRSQHRLRFFDG